MSRIWLAISTAVFGVVLSMSVATAAPRTESPATRIDPVDSSTYAEYLRYLLPQVPPTINTCNVMTNNYNTSEFGPGPDCGSPPPHATPTEAATQAAAAALYNSLCPVASIAADDTCQDFCMAFGGECVGITISAVAVYGPYIIPGGVPPQCEVVVLPDGRAETNQYACTTFSTCNCVVGP